MGYLKKTKSAEYKEAKKATTICLGTNVDPCESRFYNKFKKKSRPTDCIDKLYNKSPCTTGGKLHRNNIKNCQG